MVFVFSHIDNFRDLSDTVKRRSRVVSKILYRSATLDYASEEDLEKLVAELKVNTILDLRSEIEAQLSKLGKSFVSFPVATTLKMRPSDMTDPDPEPSVHEAEGPTRKTIMINFAGQKFRKFAVWKAAPLKIKMQIVGLIASGQKPKAVKLVGEEIIARKGLDGLYRDFIDYCDQEICEALKVLSDISNYPVLIHCTQGKDRTGLVTALALAAAGIDEDKIIEDYSKSQEGLDRVRAHMVKEMAKDGLDSSFADAPPEVMRQTFDYIREKYTDVDGYLDYIGFTPKQRDNLRRALTFTMEQRDEMIKSPPKPKHAGHRRSESTPQSPLNSSVGVNACGAWSPTSWNPTSFVEKSAQLGRSLGIPIGWRRRSDSDNTKPTNKDNSRRYISANPKAGVEMLSAGLGLEGLSHHRRSSSDDSTSSARSGNNSDDDTRKKRYSKDDFSLATSTSTATNNHSHNNTTHNNNTHSNNTEEEDFDEDFIPDLGVDVPLMTTSSHPAN